jgi:hypothetical protein
MADADLAAKGSRLKLGAEVFQLALRAHAGKLEVFKRRDARRIIAAIFEPLQRLKETRGH